MKRGRHRRKLKLKPDGEFSLDGSSSEDSDFKEPERMVLSTSAASVRSIGAGFPVTFETYRFVKVIIGLGRTLDGPASNVLIGLPMARPGGANLLEYLAEIYERGKILEREGRLTWSAVDKQVTIPGLVRSYAYVMLHAPGEYIDDAVAFELTPRTLPEDAPADAHRMLEELLAYAEAQYFAKDVTPSSLEVSDAYAGYME